MSDARPTTWDGGFIRYDSGGKPTYILRRMIGGDRFVASTHTHTLRAALEHLRRFEADPAAYDPRGTVRKPGIYLDANLAKDFLTWSRDVKRNTPKWVGEQKLYLAWWAERLKGVDLRGASIRDAIAPALEDAPARQQRIAVLKVLYAYLRTVTHAITTAEDPTYGQLSVPQSRPQQLKRKKAVPREHYELVLEHLTGRWPDLLRVLAGTGWHVTELARFAAEGTIEPLPKSIRRDDEAAQLVCPQTKSGEPLRTRVGPNVLAAAQRVRAAGPFSREHFDRAVRSACAAAGIPKFAPGQFRHAVATWAVERGADPASVAAFLGHKSPRTTKRFYATHAAPPRVPTLA